MEIIEIVQALASCDAVDDVVPPPRLYWFASQTLPLPVAAGSGLAPE